MIKKQLFNVLVAAGIIAFTSCAGNDNTKNTAVQQNTQKEEFRKGIKTIEAKLNNQNEELTLTGKVEYDPDKVINYTPLVSGIVDRTFFSLGDKVQKGQTLLNMRSSDLSSLQSELISSESDLKIAQRELQTALSMHEDNMLSDTELMEAQAKVKQAQAAYNKTQSDVAVYGTNKGNEGFSIKAPMSGYIVNKNISSGSTISADGDPLFTIADLNTVWIIANVYASNLKFVKEGMDVAITTLSYPGEVFNGKINALSQIFDPEEKVLKARIVMNNSDMKFKPEMSVVIRLKNQADVQFVTIPSDVLIFDNDKYYVVVEEPSGEFAIKQVEIQGHNNTTTYIASGLSEGENVVATNQLLIYSGLKEN